MQIDLNYAAMQTKNHADKSGRIFFSNNFMIFGSSNFFSAVQIYWDEILE